MAASAIDDVPRGLEFLLSRNRINIAVSRLQWCTVIVRSAALTDFLPSSVAGLSALGPLIGLAHYHAVRLDAASLDADEIDEHGRARRSRHNRRAQEPAWN